ncbi:NUDIX hydrolase [Pseudomonas caspiana]|uniref:DNA mismatch repair protein MutT n=1 Tax=Pseudomonas caspiana TaxID=1451454 RepID=A0A1Y3NWE3_9PSED|nr:NUDIX hydrolase [Pseudomonas caspiana]OUM71900.1 DNA mismatch repair protein MutT [Pseudomonas caspiana]
MPSVAPFSGAKIALLCEGMLLSYLRDDKPSIPWPGLWDLPGGGREGKETPLECALRETWEEFGLTISPDTVVWTQVYPGQGMGGLDTWFFVAQVPPATFANISFGNEGQRWAVTTIEAFLANTSAIKHFQHRLQEYLESNTL